MSAIYPALRYLDGERAVRFLTEAFGFEKLFTTPGPAGKIGHAELRLGQDVVMLSAFSTDPLPDSPADVRVARMSVYVAVDDVDAHHERARAAGAEIIMEPWDTDYGSREYSARDPEGHHWGFGTYRPPAG
ncbi:MAG: VOC family protein [Kutzneria sp.]|nr:VOC family protein [Kutzneria sp.]